MLSRRSICLKILLTDSRSRKIKFFAFIDAALDLILIKRYARELLTGLEWSDQESLKNMPAQQCVFLCKYALVCSIVSYQCMMPFQVCS